NADSKKVSGEQIFSAIAIEVAKQNPVCYLIGKHQFEIRCILVLTILTEKCEYFKGCSIVNNKVVHAIRINIHYVVLGSVKTTGPCRTELFGSVSNGYLVVQPILKLCVSNQSRNKQTRRREDFHEKLSNAITHLPNYCYLSSQHYSCNNTGNPVMKIEELYDIFVQGNGVSTDTRQIKAGSIFFALKGDRFNANAFAEEAINKGARFAVIDEPTFRKDERFIVVPDSLVALQDLARFHRSQLTIPVVGLTGSNGKTTSKELLSTVLATKYKTYATKGNLNNHIGVPLTLLAIDNSYEIAVVEMGA